MDATMKKWISVGLLVITAIMMFFSWIKLTDEGKRINDEIYYSVARFDPEFPNNLREYAGYAPLLLGESVDVNDLNNVIDNIEQALTLYKSMGDEISMPEMLKALGLVNDTFKIASKYPQLSHWLESELSESVNFRKIKSDCATAGLILNLLFYATLAALAATVVMHLLGLTHRGIPAGVGVAVLVIINIVLVSKTGELCQELFNESWGLGNGVNVFALTAWPFVALAFVAASIVLWSATGTSKAKAAPALAALKSILPTKPAAPAPPADAWICPECQSVSAGGAFCTSCGAKRAATIECPHCGTAVSDREKFCTECGRALNAAPFAEAQPVLCAGCGRELNANAKFCSECGTMRK